MSKNKTRWQILYADPKLPIENFTVLHYRAFKERCKVLKEKGIKFNTWDTENNALGRSFFGGK